MILMSASISLPIVFFIEVIQPTLSVFLIIGLGYLFASFKRINFGDFTTILLYLTTPCLVLTSLTKIKIETVDILYLFSGALFVICSMGIIANFIIRNIDGNPVGFYLPTMFMNSGNMGLPTVLLTFGEEGLLKAIIYFVTVGFSHFTLGIYLISGEKRLREVFSLPLIYAFVSGLLLNMLNINLPHFIAKPLEMLGNASIPLMLLSLGYFLKQIKKVPIKMAFFAALLRIGGGFLLSLIFVSIFNPATLIKKVIILQSCMPSAVINFIFSERYKCNQELVASTIFISTLMSFFTTPIVIAFLKIFF